MIPKKLLEMLDSANPQDIDKIISAVPKLFEKYSLNPSETAISSSKELLGVAKSDIKRLKYAFKRKDYPDYAFRLQQAVEKLSKSMTISFSLKTETSIRDFSHRSPEAFISLVESPNLKPLINVLPALSNPINNTSSQLKTALRKADDFQNFNPEHVRIMLNTIATVKSQLDELGLNNIIRFLLQVVTNEKTIAKKVPPLTRLITGLMILYILSGITFAHNQPTRYTDGKVKPIHYDNSHYLVNLQKEIYFCLHESVWSLEAIVKYFEDLIEIRKSKNANNT